ncbi:MAG: hypothetical protein MRZ66_00200 [Clostridiales bacterium]|nr:hypothetical protein [Clostridiales bacterium]
MAGEINKAIEWAISIANDDNHRYSQDTRWGPHYDCSSFAISAYEQAGVPVKTDGATYTGDMKAVFLKNGFEDVTSSCNLSTGSGMKKGDVLLNEAHHAALVQQDGGTTVEARGSSYGIVTNVSYRNYPWDCVLRYTRDSGSVSYTDFPRYELSESAINDIAKCITGETGGNDVLACRQEASQMVNLNEVTKGRSNTESNLLETLHGGWYSSNSWSRGCTQTAIDAVKHVMVQGKRVLPRYVTEHDTFPLDIKNAKDRSSYSKGDSVSNIYGSDYQFYCFFGEGGNGDISGYFQKDYDKYKSDIIWTEGTDSSASTEKEYHFTDTNEKIPLHSFLFDLPPINDVEDGLNIFVYSGADAKTHNVTSCLGSLEWHNSEAELATSMSFQIAKPQQDWQEYYTPEIGDVVRLYTNCETFRGVIIEVDYGNPQYNKYTCYDAGWYLNKTKDTYQFYNITVRECIRKILEDLSIPVDSISGMTSKGEELDTITVSDMYIDKTISEIFKDFIENKLPGRYNFDFTPKGFRFYIVGTETAYPEFRIAPNTSLRSSIDYRGEETHTGSFEDSKTSVKVISDTDVLAVARLDYIYQRYGLIQEVIQVNTDELTEDPYQYALEQLNKLSQPKETYSFEIVEALNSYTRAGQGLYIGDYYFVITNTDHSIENGVHKAKIDVERIEKIADEPIGDNSNAGEQ